MSDGHRAFFGDAEHTFHLTGKLVPELERVTGVGIGTLCKQLFAGDFTHGQLVQVIRLALIGGGASPEKAMLLVSVYAADRPLSETFPLVVSILETLWFGASRQEAPRAEA